MIYGYARVSTKGQERCGNSLPEQEERIRQMYPTAEIVTEAYSGAKERPVFEQLIDRLQSGDTLVVCKLDRFARSVQHGLQYIDRLREKGVRVHILNMGLIEDTPMGRLIVTNLLAFAEFERSIILERTAAGKEQARKNNPDWREGRHKIAIPDKIMKDLAAGRISQKEAARRAGVGLSTIRRRLEAAV